MRLREEQVEKDKILEEEREKAKKEKEDKLASGRAELEARAATATVLERADTPARSRGSALPAQSRLIMSRMII